MTGLSPALARGRLAGLMPPVQCICVSMGRTQPTYSDPVAAMAGRRGWACFGGALGPTGVGSCARAMGKEGGGPGAWAFQTPTEQQAAGPGSERAGLWVAGSPGPQAAGCLLLPRPPSSSSLSPVGPVKWMDMGELSCVSREGASGGLASGPSAPLARYLGWLP